MKPASQKYIFYIYSKNRAISSPDLPSGYQLKIWKPSVPELNPRGLPKFPFILWSMMHYLKLFKNTNYRIFLVYYENKIAHYSVVLPKHFKYPFMDDNDIQIGPVGTDVKHRRKGLASYTVGKIIETYKNTECKFWYLTRDGNIPSKAFIESLGFSRHGEGFRGSGPGIGILGRFYLKNK